MLNTVASIYTRLIVDFEIESDSPYFNNISIFTHFRRCSSDLYQLLSIVFDQEPSNCCPRRKDSEYLVDLLGDS